MRLQSTHSNELRELDAYFSPPEAVWSLLEIEKSHLPDNIWEPAAGNGAIVNPLRQSGFKVLASDIADYGLEGCGSGINYLTAKQRPEIKGIITNPPYKLAKQFAEKALHEVPYVALLLRTNFLESMTRMSFFKKYPPSRIWISSRRLPMMHRHGWQGKRAPSNICFAWFIWDAASEQERVIDWFDWKSITCTMDTNDFFDWQGKSLRAVG